MDPAFSFMDSSGGCLSKGAAGQARHRPREGGPRLFGTFSGVFTPTLLTILGVIMFLRLPWTVRNAGLLGGIGIILLANGITAATGLSLSSIATNTRMGAGGPEPHHGREPRGGRGGGAGEHRRVAGSLPHPCRRYDSGDGGGLPGLRTAGPQSDMDVLGLKRGQDLELIRKMMQASRSSSMFAADSGFESALA